MALRDRTTMKSLPLVKEAAPKSDSEMLDGLNRRRWMQLMGASTALGAAASGCRYEEEVIHPFAFRPEGYIPGVPVKKSGLCEIGGIARSLVTTVFDGRPIKVDGNQLHPFESLGGNSLVQSLMLQMYDPDRSRNVSMQIKAGNGSRLEKATWEQFEGEIKKAIDSGSAGLTGMGAGLAILTEPTSSPSVLRMKQALMAKYPSAGWYEYSAVNNDAVKSASKKLFGETLVPRYHFDKAEVVVCLDSDPFGTDLNSAEYARDFVKTRDIETRDGISRLWSVGSYMTVTASMADERLPLASSKIESFLAAIEAGLSAEGELETKTAGQKFLAALVSDLKANSGKSIVVVGDNQPANVHARAWKLNRQLMSIDSTVSMLPAAGPVAGGAFESLENLIENIEAGNVEGLFILGGNPAYSAPAKLELGKKLAKVPFSVHLGLYEDETAKLCNWHLNQAHCLESWTDGRSLDGTVCVGQPAILPLFGGRTVIQLLAMLAGDTSSGEAIVKQTAGLEGVAWEKALHDGFIADSAVKPASVQIANQDLPVVENNWDTKPTLAASLAEVVFIPGSVFDGSFGNSGWLQELPDPLSKVTWGNAAIVSPSTAAAWGFSQNQVVSIAINGSALKLPIHLVPGTAAGTVAIAYGYGRTEAGRIGGSTKAAIRCKPVGVNVNLVRGAENWHISSASIEGSGTYDPIATTQEHHYLDTLSLSVVNERVPRLAREGDYASYAEYVQEHGTGLPAGAADHDANHDHAASGLQHAGSDEDAKLGAVLATPVALRAKDDTAATSSKVGEAKPADSKTANGHAADDHGHDTESHDAHGHGHDTWPPQKGHHFPNFDLTPGPAYYDAPKWAMSVDLNKCTGCNACVTACQAENNISIVGKPEVIKGREMHWLRIDRYFLPRDTDQLDNPKPGQELYDNPKVVMQPVTCHHCEKAPCEQVCPVAATVHSDEGLNDMVYNRCIGTRYCGNNCPFKVRRFNYHNYSNAVTFLKYPDALSSLDGAMRIPDGDVKLMGLALNPEVSVRSRGVMEKCTFCVQRIQTGKINARNEGRDYRNGDFIDGEVTTACQDVCPTNAIVFGDASREKSSVAKNFKSVRAYELLGELNLVPRLKYLARVRNPHPMLVKTAAPAQ